MPAVGPIRPATVEVLGRTIAYASGGAGPPDVLLVHGFGADRSTWMLAMPALAGVGRVVAVDLPGHGGSATDVGAGDIPFLADIVRGFIDAVGIHAPHMVGHSLGGAVALEIATADPERLSGLSLVAPAGLDAAVDSGFFEDFVALDDPVSARATLARLVFRPSTIGTRMVEDVLAYLARPGVRAALRTILAAGFAGGRQRYRYDDRLSALPVPPDIIWGAEDRILPARTAAPPPVVLHRVEAAGHLVHLERPQAVNRILADAVMRRRRETGQRSP